MKTLLVYFLLGYTSMVLISCTNDSTDPDIVHDLQEYQQALDQAQPGDVIKLANGVWKDTELLLEAAGTPEAPITLTAEEKGKVFLEGASNLRIAGEHLVISGLVFRNGYTPTGEVISFKKDNEHLANHTRVTECVMDNFSNPERFDTDIWVAIYGKQNRFDHNYLTGKRNDGVTLAVRLNTEQSRENDHLVDHNYFGPRPNLGSNGGETLRIGTSHYSLTNSRTVVEYNYFDRCNGEHEIISNKSCQNIFRYNTFFECVGTLTMRHGNETLVDGNFFFGNGKVNTGGVRIINETQTVTNNYFQGLTGYRFRGALVIMNGVPNSPPNRYFQVIDSEASNNIFINCDHVQFCAGSDQERSAVPISTSVKNNLFYHDSKENIFTVYDDISGIEFQGNVVNEGLEPLKEDGFASSQFEVAENATGLLVPVGSNLGDLSDLEVKATPENTGVTWYPKVDEEVRFSTGKSIAVDAGINTLHDAVAASQPGDILELAGGDYHMTKSIAVNHPITLLGNAASKPLITFEKKSLFYIENGGSLFLDGLSIDGAKSMDYAGNSVVSTSRYSMNRNYKLFIDNCHITNLDVNHSFDVVKVYKNTFADSIRLQNSVFKNITGSVLSLNKETDDVGIYNAEFVNIENCVFSKVEGAVLDLYRGGKDESTFGPILTLDHCVLDDVGNGNRNKSNASISLHGVQVAHIKNSLFNQANDLKLHLVVGDPITEITNCNFFESGDIVANQDGYKTSNITSHEPHYKTDSSFELAESSELVGKADDGKNPGIVVL